MEANADEKEKEAARKVASQIAFFQRLAPTVPASYCDHVSFTGPCSIEKHKLIAEGSPGEPYELTFLRALACTVQLSLSVACRCCRYVLIGFGGS